MLLLLYTALGKPPNHYNIWMSALCQSLTTLLADFVSLACDWKYHSIDYFTHWVTDMRIFLMYILIIITLGSSRCARVFLLDGCHDATSPSFGCLCASAGVTFESSCRLCVELLMLFCPEYTQDEGILLRYCDKPSLFGRIGKHS